MAARASAEAAGHAPELAREGALLQPDAASGKEPPPPGDYRCRTIKLGAQGTGSLAYVAYPAFTCRITAKAGGRLSFVKIDGSQRPTGTIYPDVPGRSVFLGTMALGDEAGALPYGADAERDMIGGVEQIGPRRWRLFFPQPRWESLIDVLELVPA